MLERHSYGLDRVIRLSRAKLQLKPLALICACFVILLALPSRAWASDEQDVYRLYNPYTGEHLFTTDAEERANCVKVGWASEGVCWTAPSSQESDTVVYRLYNRYNGEHLYTTDMSEYEGLVDLGWTGEGEAFRSAVSDEAVPVYRLFNPFVSIGTHLYTTDESEVRNLLSLGWRKDGTDGVPAFYGYEAATPIMGETQLTGNQLAAYYIFRVGETTYPSSVYAGKGAATIYDFCNILVEEANTEGVRAEVLFVQVMKETGWLRFTGHVNAEKCNFGGIGAVDSSPGDAATFPDVRTGLRAQVQHLKAYATTDEDNLVNACVDPRFEFVTRGSSPYVEGLGGKWASDPSYGTSLVNMMDQLLSYFE